MGFNPYVAILKLFFIKKFRLIPLFISFREKMPSNPHSAKKDIFTKINEDIILIHQDSMETMNFNSCNSYLVKINNNDYAIIDPGCSKKKLNTTLRQNEILISDIKYSLLSHAHSDHMNLLDYIQKKNENIEVFIHKADKKYVENAKEYYNMLFNFEIISKNQKYHEFIKAVKYYTNPNSTIQVNPSFKMIFDIWNVKNRKVDHAYKDRDKLPGDLEVIHAPGHTPGMSFFFKEKDKILFSSDIHLSSIGPNFSGNQTNILDFKNSIKKVIKMVNDELINIILSGHGRNPIKENLKKRLLTFYEKIIFKEEELINILQNNPPMNIGQITDYTFKNYVKRFQKYLVNNKSLLDTLVIAEASELMSNLNILKELEREKKVKKILKENEYFWLPNS